MGDSLNKYRRMLAHWKRQSDRLAPDISAMKFPPQRWRRSDRIDTAFQERYGQRYAEYRQFLAEANQRKVSAKWPLHIDIDVVDSSNLACINCNQNFRPWTRKKLDPELLFNDPLFGKGKFLSFNFGAYAEPFLEPDTVLRTVEFLRRIGSVDIYIHTNGALLTDDIIERLVELEVSWLLISIDAHSEETFSLLRGKEYAKVKQAVHRAVEIRDRKGAAFPLVRTSCVALPENLHELWAFHEYWKQYVDMVEFQNFINQAPLGEAPQSHVQASDLYERMSGFSCGQPFWRLSIGPGGVVGPCCTSYGHHDPDLMLGNLNSGETIEEMWNGDKMRSIREQHLRAGGPKGLPSCLQCLSSNNRFKHYAETDAEDRSPTVFREREKAVG